ncbi:MAG: DUF4175 domain-containing protein, partial [Paracoccaceae bacterium]|nr:DUF4175 domain-containing protein [Paracoccaceae bacterium]
DMLREMMENMEMAGQPNAGGQQSPGQQAMESLSDMLRQQQGLNDDTFQGLQDRFGSTDDPSQQPSPQGQPGAEGSQQGLGPGQSFADRQNALRNELSELLDRLPGSGSSLGDEARDTLERSGRAMDEAERSLRDEDLAGALDDQSRALETLREGARDLAEQLSQQQGQGEQGEAFGRGSEAERRDPLGRQTGSDGKPYSDERVLGEDAPFQRAEDLIEELRRRSSEKARPQFELDYLKRLLERF